MSHAPRRTTRDVIQRIEETASIIERRKAGLSLQEIANQDGVTVSAVSHRITRYLASQRTEPAAETVALELARLDELQAGLWAAATREANDPGPYAPREDFRKYEHEVSSQARAVEQVLRVMDRRAKMLGFDHAELRKTEMAKRELDHDQARIVGEVLTRIMGRLGVPREQYGPIAAEEFRRIAAEQQPDLLAGEIEDEGDWDDEMD